MVLMLMVMRVCIHMQVGIVEGILLSLEMHPGVTLDTHPHTLAVLAKIRSEQQSQKRTMGIVADTYVCVCCAVSSCVFVRSFGWLVASGDAILCTL